MPQLSTAGKSVRLAASLRPKTKSLMSVPSLYDSIVTASKAIKYGVPTVGVGGLAAFAKSSTQTKEAALRVLANSETLEKSAANPLALLGKLRKAPKAVSRLFTKSRRTPAKLELPRSGPIVHPAPASELNPKRAPSVMWDSLKARPQTPYVSMHPAITAADLEAARAVSIAAPTRFQNAWQGFMSGWGNRAAVMPTTPVGGVFDRAHTAGKHIYNNRGTYGVAAGLGGMGVVDHSIDAARKRALENMSPWQRMQAAGSLLFSPKSLTNKIW